MKNKKFYFEMTSKDMVSYNTVLFKLAFLEWQAENNKLKFELRKVLKGLKKLKRSKKGNV